MAEVSKYQAASVANRRCLLGRLGVITCPLLDYEEIPPVGAVSETALNDNQPKSRKMPPNSVIAKRYVIHEPGSIFEDDDYLKIMEELSDPSEFTAMPGITVISQDFVSLENNEGSQESLPKLLVATRKAVAGLPTRLYAHTSKTRLFGGRSPGSKVHVAFELDSTGKSRVSQDLAALRQNDHFSSLQGAGRAHISVMATRDHEKAADISERINEIHKKLMPVALGELTPGYAVSLRSPFVDIDLKKEHTV